MVIPKLGQGGGATRPAQCPLNSRSPQILPQAREDGPLREVPGAHQRELHSRYEVYIEQYSKQINIEAQTAIQMARRQYLPAAVFYTNELADTIAKVKAAGGTAAFQESLLKKVSTLLDSAGNKAATLEEHTGKAKTMEGTAQAEYYRDSVFTSMAALRADIDALEAILPSELWPVPTYCDLLFGCRTKTRLAVNRPVPGRFFFEKIRNMTQGCHPEQISF
jgi:hypothetical protein